MFSGLLFPILVAGAFMLGGIIFYGIGFVVGIDRAARELRLHREQQRLRVEITPGKVTIQDPTCTFCQFVKSEIREMEPADEIMYLHHLSKQHGLTR